MPKAANATVDDISALREELTGAINSVKSSAASDLNAVKGQIKQISDSVNANAASGAAATTKATVESKEFAQSLVALEVKQLKAYIEGDCLGKMRELVEELKQQVISKEMPSFKESIAAEIESMKADLSARAERLKEETAETLVASEKKLSAALEKASAEAAAAREVLTKSVERLEKMEGDMTNVKDVGDSRKEEADLKEGELHLKVDRIGDRVKDLEAIGKTLVSRKEMESGLKGIGDPVDKRLIHLETEVPKAVDAVAEVDNIATRRVDWIIQKASQKLRPPRTSRAQLHASYFSPKFCCSGVSDLQLELQLFRKGDPPVSGESEGDCAVFLWATKGMSITYKLSVGGKSAELHKVFNGRVPYGTQRFCFVKDQIHRETDTLQVSVEILEIIKQVEHVITHPEPTEPVERGEDEEETPADKLPLDCTVRYRKNVNNRILDQVRHQVDIMRSRMVRKVEWRVEQASMLRRCFPEGEPICSTSFSAAGVEGMQLIFYPSGYSGCTAGYCSFFLYAPAGATIRCTLIAGGQRREAHHCFEDSGAFGRTNFCRLESAIGEDDTLLLGLEIEEAHQDMQATVAHPTVQPGDRRTAAQMDGSVPTAVNSVVKLQRTPGKTIKGMDDSKILPSLWMAKPLTERGAASEKPRAFEDFRGTGSSSSPHGAGTTGQLRPGSSPAPAGPADQPALLPELSKDGCSPDKARKGADRRLGRGRAGARSTSAL